MRPSTFVIAPTIGQKVGWAQEKPFVPESKNRLSQIAWLGNAPQTGYAIPSIAICNDYSRHSTWVDRCHIMELLGETCLAAVDHAKHVYPEILGIESIC
jgi:hypothetical protein